MAKRKGKLKIKKAAKGYFASRGLKGRARESKKDRFKSASSKKGRKR